VAGGLVEPIGDALVVAISADCTALVMILYIRHTGRDAGLRSAKAT